MSLLGVLTHLIGETRQHAGQADILRELLDGTIGSRRNATVQDDETFWTDRWAEVERVARSVAPRAD